MGINRLLFILLIFILGLSYQSVAQGDLLITQNRVVFDGNKQKEEINLVNIGKDTSIYSISFLQYNMKEDGSFVTVEKPDSGQLFADSYLRIFPRKVTLAPGEPQVVMLQCRRKAGMPAGEYRSHLYFRSELNYRPLDTKNSEVDTTALSIQLIPIYGMAIPIIIRSGEVTVSASLSDFKLENQQESVQNLKFTINRIGNISIYGDINIEYIPSIGQSYKVGTLKGVGVYTNINKRNLVVKLNNTSKQLLTGGKLKVQFISNNETKQVVYAEGELQLN